MPFGYTNPALVGQSNESFGKWIFWINESYDAPAIYLAISAIVS
jgi:hypothetical protein